MEENEGQQSWVEWSRQSKREEDENKIFCGPNKVLIRKRVMWTANCLLWMSWQGLSHLRPQWHWSQGRYWAMLITSLNTAKPLPQALKICESRQSHLPLPYLTWNRGSWYGTLIRNDNCSGWGRVQANLLKSSSVRWT